MTTPSALNTALAEPELKPCPFCDGKPKGAYDENSGSWEIFCTGCGCTMMAITEADCASWWNGRAFQSKDDDAAREIDRLKGEIARLRAAQYAFELWARLAFLWGDKPARAGEVDQYRVAYHKWLAALQTHGGKSE